MDKEYIFLSITTGKLEFLSLRELSDIRGDYVHDALITECVSVDGTVEEFELVRAHLQANPGMRCDQLKDYLAEIRKARSEA